MDEFRANISSEDEDDDSVVSHYTISDQVEPNE